MDPWVGIEATIRVLLVDSHEIPRRGVADYLEQQDKIEVVGECGTASEALAHVREKRPDLVILDAMLPDATGAQLIRELGQAYPKMRCMVLAAERNDAHAYDCMMAGVSGYVLHTISGKTLAATVKAVGSGIGVFGIGVADPVRALIRQERELGILSPQERRILELMALGLSNKQIGHRIALSEKTVKNYASAVLKKLGLGNRAEAAAYITRASLRVAS